jgi:hypothetical protein
MVGPRPERGLDSWITILTPGNVAVAIPRRVVGSRRLDRAGTMARLTMKM